MKQPKKLTREQKECLSAHYLNCKDWMLVEETEFYYRIINKNTGVIKSVEKPLATIDLWTHSVMELSFVMNLLGFLTPTSITSSIWKVA